MQRSRLPFALAAVVVASLAPAAAAQAVSPCPGGYTVVSQAGSTAVCELTFTSSTTWTPPAGVTTVDVLIVGGGGGGANGSRNGDPATWGGGGGGGGQMRVVTNKAVAGSITVTVGAGGTNGFAGTAGGFSGFADDTASGGGGGSASRFTSTLVGGSSWTYNRTATTGGSTVASSGLSAAGGGGGTGGNGQSALNNARGGDGGAGLSPQQLNSTVSTGLFASSTTVYGVGGGGGAWTTPGFGQVGGGGTGAKANGSQQAAQAGRTNAGGGGGGGFDSNLSPTSNPGGAGGSGVVVVRFTVAIPPTAPGAPTITSVVAGAAIAEVSWSVDDTGRSPLTSIEFALDDTTAVDDSTTDVVGPYTLTGLTNGQTYVVYVRAVNAVGTGPWSLASAPFTPVAPPPPPVFPASAPRDIVAVPGDASATASWMSPESSGSFPVTTYMATASPGGATCLSSTTSCTIKGLSNGTRYTITVQALNGAGWSVSSAPSNAVIPRPSTKVTISIVGSREGRHVVVSGRTSGLAGQAVQPWVRLAGQGDFTASTTTAQVRPDGTFTWSRRTARSMDVYVTAGGERSNVVSIPAR